MTHGNDGHVGTGDRRAGYDRADDMGDLVTGMVVGYAGAQAEYSRMTDYQLKAEICKTLATKQEIRQCLVQVQRENNHADEVTGGVLLVILVIAIGVCIWGFMKSFW